MFQTSQFSPFIVMRISAHLRAYFGIQRWSVLWFLQIACNSEEINLQYFVNASSVIIRQLAVSANYKFYPLVSVFFKNYGNLIESSPSCLYISSGMIPTICSISVNLTSQQNSLCIFSIDFLWSSTYFCINRILQNSLKIIKQYRVTQMDNDQQQVKTYRSIWAIIRIVCFYNIGSIYFGYSYVYFSAIPFNVIQKVFNMPFSKEIAQGILYGCVPFGAAIGGLLAERVLQKLSRKQTFFFFNALAALSAILIYTKNPYCLIIGRILQGLCVGAYPGLAALMVRQLCPIEISVMMGSAQVLFINFGLFTGFTFSYILSKHFQTEYYLNLTFAVPIYLIAIQQILFHFYFQNETPKYQFLKGNYQKARNIISQFYLPDHQNQVYHRILKDLESDYEALEEREKQYPKDSWKAVFICVCLALFHQLSGIGIILLYSSEIAATFFNNDPLLFSVMLCSTKLVSSVILNIVLRKHDQKPTALIGIFIISSALMTFYIGITHKNQFLPTTPYLLTAAILIHAFGFILAFSSMYSYFAQSLQPNKVPVMVSINELTNALLSSFFPTLRSLSGDPDCPPVFLVMFFCMVTAFIVCWKFMVRTQGKTQLQIREEYEAIKSC